MGKYCAHLGYNVMLGLLRKHKDWNDELIEKVKEDEKQSILEQIRMNKMFFSQDSSRSKRKTEICR